MLTLRLFICVSKNTAIYKMCCCYEYYNRLPGLIDFVLPHFLTHQNGKNIRIVFCKAQKNAYYIFKKKPNTSLRMLIKKTCNLVCIIFKLERKWFIWSSNCSLTRSNTKPNSKFHFGLLADYKLPHSKNLFPLLKRKL